MTAVLARPASGCDPSPVPTCQRHYWFPGMAADRFVFTALPAGAALTRILADSAQHAQAVDTDGELEALWAGYREGVCPASVLADFLDDRRPADAGADWDSPGRPPWLGPAQTTHPCGSLTW